MERGDFEKGVGYFISAEKYSIEDLLSVLREGDIYFTNKYQNDQGDRDYELYWITTRRGLYGVKLIHPTNLPEMSNIVLESKKESFIVIDSFELLRLYNGLELVLKSFNSMNSFLATRGSNLIIYADPKAFTEVDYRTTLRAVPLEEFS